MKNVQQDEDLVKGIRNHNEQAIADFYRAKWAHLENFARMLSDRFPSILAEDLIQETLLDTIEAIQKGTYNEEGKINAYLEKVFALKALQEVTTRKRHEDLLSRNAHKINIDSTPLDKCVEYEQLLYLLVKSLPKKHQEIARLRAYQYTHEEIAELLKISPETSRKRWSRAVEQIRKYAQLIGITKILFD